MPGRKSVPLRRGFCCRLEQTAERYACCLDVSRLLALLVSYAGRARI